MIKNSREAEATVVEIELYHDKQTGILTQVVRDNGKGMGPEEIAACVTPGITSKRKEATEPNFGQGLFTALGKKEFSIMIVITRKNGFCNVFKIEKVGEDLEIQIEEESETSLSNGTEIFLQKKMTHSPFSTAITINSHLIQTCRHLKGMEVRLNGNPLAKPENPLILTNSFLDQLGNNKTISMQFLRKETGTVYVNGLKMGPMPEDYFSLVPQFLFDFYKKKRISFALFLPSVEQVMGRSIVQTDSNMEFAIQHLFLKGSLIFLIEEWKRGRKLEHFITQDIWDITLDKSYQLTGKTRKFFDFTFGNGATNLLLDAEERIEVEPLIAAVKDFVSSLSIDDRPDGVLKALCNNSKSKWPLLAPPGKQHILS